MIFFSTAPHTINKERKKIMKCNKCNAEISVDDITMNVNDTDIELVIQCPECEFERGLYVDNNDFHNL